MKPRNTFLGSLFAETFNHPVFARWCGEVDEEISIWCLSKIEFSGKASIQWYYLLLSTRHCFLWLVWARISCSLRAVSQCQGLDQKSALQALWGRNCLFFFSYSMSHCEALTWLRLSQVINKSVLIIMSNSHLRMRKWFITPICWIIHSSGAKMAWNMSSEDVEVFSVIGILFWY